MCIKCARCRIYETMCTPTQDAVCRKNVFTTAVFTTPQRQAFVDGTPTVKTGNAATSFPGSFLERREARKNPGFGWSRVTQILGDKLK